MLKVMIKRPSNRTRQQKKTYQNDLTSRWEEIRCLEKAGIEHNISIFDFTLDSTIAENESQPSTHSVSSLRSVVSQVPNSNIRSFQVSRVVHKMIFHPISQLWELVTGSQRSNILSFPEHNSVEREICLKKAKDHCEVVGVSRFDIHYSAKLNLRNGLSENTCLIRRHPNFHGPEWYDWVLVKYVDDDGTIHKVPSRLLMLISYEVDTELEHGGSQVKMCAIVYPFKSNVMRPYHMLNSIFGGILHDRVFAIEIDDIQDVAFVVPVVPPRRPYDNFVAERYIVKEYSENEYFIYIPPQSQWHEFDIL